MSPAPRAADADGVLRRRTWSLVQPWTATALRLLLAGVLATAGLLKLPDPAQSVRAVRAYQLLPEGLVQLVGYGLPVLEVALAVLLLLGLATRMAAVATAGLLVVFIVGIVSAAARGLAIDCGCFGGGGSVAPAETRYTAELLRDTALLGAALVLARWPTSRLSADAALAQPRHELTPDPLHDPLTDREDVR